jgi:predicted permease
VALVRATARARELAVRAALGAGRARLVAQLLVESSLLAVAGAVLGALFADWAVRALVAASPSGLPRAAEMAVDGRALAFAAAIATGVALLTGIVPALRATRLDLLGSLREGAPAAGTSEGARRLRGGFVVAQVSLALVLLVGAGLLLKSFARLQSEELGFRPDRLVALRLHPDAARYDTPEKSMNLYRAVVERVAAIPGVEAVTYVNFIPVTTVGVPTRLTIPGREPAPDETFSAEYNLVSSNYFEMLGIPVRMGRGIEAGDMNESSTAIVINETLARQYWPGANPVGRPLTVYKQVSGRPDFKQPIQGEVVGVVGDVRSAGPGVPVGPEVFLPFARNPWRNVYITVRTKRAPEPLIGQIRQAALAIDPNLPVDDLQTMDEMLALRLARRRLDTTLLGSFAAAALLLAAVGIYGVVAYAVSQRRHEIGVRMALGATPGGVVRLVVRQGIVLGTIGVAIGTLGALALSRSLKGLLYEVSAMDPLVYGGIAVLLLGVAVAASAIPAVRASRLDPSSALRQD